MSRKYSASLMAIQAMPSPLQKELRDAEIVMVTGKLSTLTLQSTIQKDILEAQDYDPACEKMRKWAQEKEDNGFSTTKEGVIMYKGRLCVPDYKNIRNEILYDAHNTP